MKIVIGSDHAAFEEKTSIVESIKAMGIECDDLGTHNGESCDYPDFAQAVCKAVLADEDVKGVLICGTGLGMSISANRFKGIRAALCHSEKTAEMSRLHNDANVLVLGARVLEMDDMKSIVKVWLDTAFEGGRHQRRLDKIENV